MRRFLLPPWLAFPVAVAVGLTIGAVAGSVWPRDRLHVTTSPATQPQLPRPLGGTDPAAVQAKPVYEGLVGDFIVGHFQGSSLPPCPRPLRPAKSDKIRSSELYSPVFSELFGDLEGLVAECADGKITGIELYGKEIIDRVYFVGKPVVPFEAPIDRLKLLKVAGKPAIAQLAEPGVPGTLRLAVIERFPKGNKLGILVEIDETYMSLDSAVDLAARIMGVRP